MTSKMMGFIIGFNLLSIWTFGAIYAVPLARYQQSNHNLYDTVNNQYDITTPKHINDLDANHVERAMTDVTSTLKEVEKILESDPSLPRLTRGEIEELFENVTKEEYEKSLQIGDMKRAKHMRALMLVLPYNTNNYSQDHLQELYNRPPVTKVIDNDGKQQKLQQNINVPHKIVEQPYTGKVEIVSMKIPPTTYRPTVEQTKKKFIEKPIVNFHQLQPQMHASLELTQLPMNSEQSIFTFPSIATNSPGGVDNKFLLKGEKYSSHYNGDVTPFKHLPTVQPIRENVKDLLASIGLKPEVGTSTTQKPPKLTPELKGLLQSFGLLTNERLPIENPSTLDEYADEEFRPIVSSLIKETPLTIDEFDAPRSMNISTVPTTESHKTISTTTTTVAPITTTIAFKTMPTTKLKDVHPPLAAQIIPSDFIAFKPLPIPDDNTDEINSDVEDFLKSYGILTAGRSQKSLRTKGNSLNALGEVKGQSEKTSTTVRPTVTTTRTTTTTIKMETAPIVEQAMLTPELASILENIGISVTQPKPVSKKDIDPARKEERILTSPNTDAVIRLPSPDDAEDYKKLQILLETIKELDNLNTNLTSAEIESLNPLHYNLSEGLLAQGPDPVYLKNSYDLKNEIKRQTLDSPNSTANTETSEPIRFQLDLDPTVPPVSASKGIETLEIIENTKVETDNNLSPIAEDLIVTTELPSVPDTTVEAAVDEDVTTTTTTEATVSSTEEARNGLEDSFGGGLDPVDEEPLPTPRKNGFYFMADWNSFLEVGTDSDQNKVVIRFDPKIGDPSPFIPVKIP